MEVAVEVRVERPICLLLEERQLVDRDRGEGDDDFTLRVARETPVSNVDRCDPPMRERDQGDGLIAIGVLRIFGDLLFVRSASDFPLLIFPQGVGPPAPGRGLAKDDSCP